MIEYIKIVVAMGLISLFFACASFNLYFLIKNILFKKSVPSWIPFVGGVSGAIGVWLIDRGDWHRFWWCPLFLDWGSLTGHLVGIFFSIKGWARK